MRKKPKPKLDQKMALISEVGKLRAENGALKSDIVKLKAMLRKELDAAKRRPLGDGLVVVSGHAEIPREIESVRRSG